MLDLSENSEEDEKIEHTKELSYYLYSSNRNEGISRFVMIENIGHYWRHVREHFKLECSRGDTLR